MLHQILFLVFFFGLLPTVLLSPFAGILIYQWLDWLPAGDVYSATLLPDYLSFFIGALTFLLWLIREEKTLRRPLLLMLLMATLLVWINVTSYYALVPEYAGFEWNRTVKVIGASVLAAQMLSTRARLEALVWTFVLAVIYFAVPGAIKVIVSGGSGGIGTGEVVVAANNSFFNDRVIFSVVLAMALPFALYLGRQTTLLPPRWLRWVKTAMLGAALCFLVALIGTFARTALITGAATLLAMTVRAQRKALAIAMVIATCLVLFAIAPDNWYLRMDTIIHYQGDDSAMSRLDAWRWAWHMAVSHPIFGGGFGVFHLDAGDITGRSGWLEAHNIFFQVMAEHGFVGLALFCAIIVATHHYCAIVLKRVRQVGALTWTAALARATQIGLVAFVVGGSFVSIATTPFLYMLAAIAIGTRSLVEREIAEARRRTARETPLALQAATGSSSPRHPLRPLVD